MLCLGVREIVQFGPYRLTPLACPGMALENFKRSTRVALVIPNTSWYKYWILPERGSRPHKAFLGGTSLL